MSGGEQQLLLAVKIASFSGEPQWTPEGLDIQAFRVDRVDGPEHWEAQAWRFLGTRLTLKRPLNSSGF